MYVCMYVHINVYIYIYIYVCVYVVSRVEHQWSAYKAVPMTGGFLGNKCSQSVSQSVSQLP